MKSSEKLKVSHEEKTKINIQEKMSLDWNKRRKNVITWWQQMED
jgi:hypothetical protein